MYADFVLLSFDRTKVLGSTCPTCSRNLDRGFAMERIVDGDKSGVHARFIGSADAGNVIRIGHSTSNNVPTGIHPLAAGEISHQLWGRKICEKNYARFFIVASVNPTSSNSFVSILLLCGPLGEFRV